MGLKLTTPPTTTVLATSDIKTHLNIDIDADDNLLADGLRDAERYVENYTQRQLLTATWTLTMDCFPDWEIQVPRPPLQSLGISYVDTDGTTTTLASSLYRVSTNGLLGRVSPAYGETWPATQLVIDAVTVTIVAGATGSSDVPREAKRAIKMLAAHYYVNRTAVVTGTITQIQELAVQSLLGNLAVGDYA